MYRFIETLRIEHRQLIRPEWHERRLNDTRYHFFDKVQDIDLSRAIQIPQTLTEATYKCRVVYSSDIEAVTFEPYHARDIRSLQVVYDDKIDYAFKYYDRSAFNDYLNHSSSDDILIVKQGCVTDTSFSNIVFYDGKDWITPSYYLLNGIQRQYLLQQGIIIERKIKLGDLSSFYCAKLINAMLPFESSRAIDVALIYS
ncbi:aminotransferase class IV [Microbacter margulisiae]|uniref:4-amino-4-deoxychorismate lyase n=1 Tax=Microbacter margulisiae TaxID=1350067 RepID=A0A7W5H1A7_9PORP|nr:aminotransferase class IV [Microbacter margulisiae]MBB3186500.1 4-amino-4-deoxychorismate lyase [Microbacter margulisiae]